MKPEGESAVRHVMHATGWSEGDARLLVGRLLAHFKHRSIEEERDSWRAVAAQLATALRWWIEADDAHYRGPQVERQGDDALAAFDALTEAE